MYKCNQCAPNVYSSNPYILLYLSMIIAQATLLNDWHYQVSNIEIYSSLGVVVARELQSADILVQCTCEGITLIYLQGVQVFDLT